MLGGLSAVALNFGRHSPVASVVGSHSVRLLLTGLLFAGCGSLVAISPLGRLSGAHLNPAVTLAFGVLGRVSRHDLVGYIAAQLVGALGGALAFHLLWSSEAVSVGGGVTHPTVSHAGAICLEAAMTALVVMTILFFVSRAELARWTPLALWPLIATFVWQVADYTGTSLNPARSAGPAIAFGDLRDLWLYFLAPPLGALTVALLWSRRHPSKHPKTAKLFHDPRYPSSLMSELPAMAPDDPMP